FKQFGEGNAWMFAIAGAITPFNRMALKALPINWSNPEARGLPHMYGVILLCEQASGLPLCLMDGTFITNMRTGALAGVGAKYLARKDSETLALIGTREIARNAALAISASLPSLRSVRVYSRSAANRELFVREMSGQLRGEVSKADSVEQAVSGADIVVTATSAGSPVFKASMVEPGMYIHAMGSKNEVDPSALAKSKVVAEGKEECKSHGKWGEALRHGLTKEADLHGELADVISGKRPGRTSKSEVFFLDSVGLPVEDVILASRVYDEAVKAGVGTSLDLYEGLRNWS
ncbi:MAG TPA: ornithine cyclodeaminase family protein, partial [Nitrososphaerales archaeon]|nr:ornithine cyclodeaminase family protein [Nitrososphaerales archaeon]